VWKTGGTESESSQSSLEEGQDTAHKLFAAKDPQEFLSLTTAQAQPGRLKRASLTAVTLQVS